MRKTRREVTRILVEARASQVLVGAVADGGFISIL